MFVPSQTTVSANPCSIGTPVPANAMAVSVKPPVVLLMIVHRPAAAGNVNVAFDTNAPVTVMIRDVACMAVKTVVPPVVATEILDTLFPAYGNQLTPIDAGFELKSIEFAAVAQT